MHIHTKIICTIGPAVDSVEKMIELINAGMNVARLNFSHGTHEKHLETIKRLKEARAKTLQPLAIMLDTKGPEIRVGKLINDAVEVAPHNTIKIVREAKRGEISIHPFEVLETVEVGMQILFDDGYIISKVVEKDTESVTIEILNEGVIKSGKGVNIPEADLNLPPVTENDVADLKFGCKHEIDIVAASFIRSAEHVLAIKKLLAEEGRPDIPIIAKIENMQGIKNFDAILEVADGIMIARGDLGVEINLGMVPRLQKMMIKKVYRAFKPAVTATQMLESMIVNPRPTRAEVSDVANAIYDSTSAVMLSGETAVGKYPVEVVKQMKNVIKHTEEDFDYLDFFNHRARIEYSDVSASVAIAAVKMAYNVGAKALFVYTSSGFTARLISALRPNKPIVALTSNKKTYHQLAIMWGVFPVFVENCQSEDEAFVVMSNFAKAQGLVIFGDLVVTTAGVPFGKKGSTNMVMVSNIGHILVRGAKGHGRKTEGKIIIVMSKKEVKPEDVKDKIIVIPRCDESYLSLMKEAAGVILQNQQGDTVSEKYATFVSKSFDISLLVRADNAISILADQDVVILDPKRGLVYKNPSQ